MSVYKNNVEYQIIKDAVSGNAVAINEVIKHYKGYIHTVSVVKMIDMRGNERDVVDMNLAKILELHLVTQILRFRV